MDFKKMVKVLLEDRYTQKMQDKYGRTVEIKNVAFQKFINNEIDENEFKSLLREAGFGDSKIKDFLSQANQRRKETTNMKNSFSPSSKDIEAKKKIESNKGPKPSKEVISKVSDSLKGSGYYLNTIIYSPYLKNKKPSYCKVFLNSRNRYPLELNFVNKGSSYSLDKEDYKDYKAIPTEDSINEYNRIKKLSFVNQIQKILNSYII